MAGTPCRHLFHTTGFRAEAPQHPSRSRASGGIGRRDVVTGRHRAKRFYRKDLTVFFTSESPARCGRQAVDPRACDEVAPMPDYDNALTDPTHGAAGGAGARALRRGAPPRWSPAARFSTASLCKQRAGGKTDASLKKPRKRCLPTVREGAKSPTMNPTQKQFSLNRAASKKQIPISSTHA